MSKSPLRILLAWSVHTFTASGAVLGLLSIFAIQQHDWRQAFIWMALAVIVDGLDGWLARLAQVKTYAPGLDGALMDNLIDYVTYVLVPALFLYEAELVPPAYAIPAGAMIMLTSAYQFSQTNAKTEDHFFLGFPSYWNFAVAYLLILNWNPWVNLAFLALLGMLIFAPIKYIYPSRTRAHQRLTIIVTYTWAAITLAGLLQYPDIPAWLIPLTWVYAAYYIGMSLWAGRTHTT